MKFKSGRGGWREGGGRPKGATIPTQIGQRNEEIAGDAHRVALAESLALAGALEQRVEHAGLGEMVAEALRLRAHQPSVGNGRGDDDRPCRRPSQ